MGLLSDVLNPIVDHNLPRRIFRNSRWNESRSKLVSTGVLSPAFALHLWRNVFPRHSPRSSTSTFETALFDVLVKLDLATPLGQAKFREGVDRSPSVSSHTDCIHGHPNMLVWRWLPDHLGERGEATFKTLVEQLGDRAQEVTLNWQFDSAGAPHGLITRLMALCHVIGEAEEALCWRSGAVFRSSRAPEATHPEFVVEIRYSTMEKMLSATVRGTLSSERLWVALRFVASLMVHFSKDWPGALWGGWVACADHPLQCLHLATPTEVYTQCRICLGQLYACSPVSRASMIFTSSYRQNWISRFLYPFSFGCVDSLMPTLDIPWLQLTPFMRFSLDSVYGDRRCSGRHWSLQRASDVLVGRMQGLWWGRWSLGLAMLSTRRQVRCRLINAGSACEPHHKRTLRAQCSLTNRVPQLKTYRIPYEFLCVLVLNSFDD